jgi:F-type H+-transporting ATPase subunit alpha
VGGNAQTKAMKKVAGTLRLDLAQFRELEAFAAFGSDLDKASQSQLDRGNRLVEVLKQPQFQPVALGEQVAIIWAATKGYLDAVPVRDVKAFEKALVDWVKGRDPGLLSELDANAALDTVEDRLAAAAQGTLDQFTAAADAAATTAALPKVGVTGSPTAPIDPTKPAGMTTTAADEKAGPASTGGSAAPV